jgi:hypothetical protein
MKIVTDNTPSLWELAKGRTYQVRIGGIGSIEVNCISSNPEEPIDVLIDLEIRHALGQAFDGGGWYTLEEARELQEELAKLTAKDENK